MKTKIVWGVPVAMVIVGLLVLLFAHLQPHLTATVLAIDHATYTPAKRMARGHSEAHYRSELLVSFTDPNGNEATATVEFISTHRNAFPKVGDEIPISRGLTGMVAHPNRNLIGLGGGAAVIGGLFLFMFWLTWLSLKRKRQ